MSGYSNVTFDEIEIGATASAERVVGQTEIEALLLVSGDVVPFNLVEGVTVEPSDLCVEAVAAEAIISGMLERRLPGPGTRIVSQQLEFNGVIREEADTAPSPFREVWNMTKPKNGDSGWLVAGVQALQ